MSVTSRALAAVAPSPLSEYLARLKLAQRHQRRADGHRRRITSLRLGEAEAILRAVIEGGDMLAEVKLDQSFMPRGRDGVALFVTMTMLDFRRLCRYGAELEDDEDTHDDEPASDDEPSLGSRDAEPDQTRAWVEAYADLEGPEADDEPSLGSCDGIANQERWHEGYHHGDNEFDNSLSELDEADDEPSLCGVEGCGAEHARPDDQGRVDMEGDGEDAEPDDRNLPVTGCRP